MKKKNNRNKQMKQKINTNNKKNTALNVLSTIIAIITTILSLIISIASWNISQASLKVSEEALEISNRSYLLASKDMEPNVDFELEKDRFKLINNTTDLFKIDTIEVMSISILEFEDYKTDKFIRTYTPTLSNYELISEKNRYDKEIYLNFQDPSPLGFNTFTDKELEEQVEDKLYNEYNLNSKKGFSSFGMRTWVWLIRIGYENKFKEYKDLYFTYRHLYGIGEFVKLQISEEEANKLINNCQIPKYKDINDYWNIILTDNKYLVENLNRKSD